MVGTEYQQLYLLDESFKVSKNILLSGTPITIQSNQEGEVAILMRQKFVALYRNWEPYARIDLHSKPISMLKQDQSIFVAMMDNSINAYSFKSIKKQYSLSLQKPILCMENLEYGRSKNIKVKK